MLLCGWYDGWTPPPTAHIDPSNSNGPGRGASMGASSQRRMTCTQSPEPLLPGLDHHVFITQRRQMPRSGWCGKQRSFCSRNLEFISKATVASTWHAFVIFNYLHFVGGQNWLNRVLHFVKVKTVTQERAGPGVIKKEQIKTAGRLFSDVLDCLFGTLQKTSVTFNQCWMKNIYIISFSFIIMHYWCNLAAFNISDGIF